MCVCDFVVGGGGSGADVFEKIGILSEWRSVKMGLTWVQCKFNA
jgi:hypothetical protein